MRVAALILCLLAAAPAPARNLCGLEDRGEVLAAIAGTWTAEEAVSLENATTSLLRRPAPGREIVTGEGLLATPFLDDTTGGAVALRLAGERPYDVDAVDDVLETTESEAFADILSETRCGPEEVPQLVARIAEGDGAAVSGTVTLLAYFDDRMLRISELTLRGDGAVLFMVATALLTRAE